MTFTGCMQCHLSESQDTKLFPGSPGFQSLHSIVAMLPSNVHLFSAYQCLSCSRTCSFL